MEAFIDEEFVLQDTTFDWQVTQMRRHLRNITLNQTLNLGHHWMHRYRFCKFDKLRRLTLSVQTTAETFINRFGFDRGEFFGMSVQRLQQHWLRDPNRW